MRPKNADAPPVGGDASPKLTAAAVQLQLSKILASPHFRNSKRSQSLLRHVVEAQLAGETDSLKERCIGAAVFNRDNAYDTAQDPIVRNAAIDVRKRLALYYLDPQHSSELRIELPTGSYQPVFIPETQAGGAELPILDIPPDDFGTVDVTPVEVELPAVPPTPRGRRFGKRAIALLATAATLLVAISAYSWFNRRSPATELDAFWAPLFRDGKTIQICIGQPTRLFRFIGPRTEELTRALSGPAQRSAEAAALSVSAGELAWVAPEFLYMRDALSGFRVASWIQAKGLSYELMSVASTSYSKLRQAPLVAIGAFNNTWSMRVTSELRFVFERRTVDGVAYNCIIDRRNPKALSWKVAQPISPAMNEDFAIVTRVFDPSTERTVISAAGIENYGTLAAGEFVTQADYIGAALAASSVQWRHQNVQFVLGTKVIDGTPGPPRVLAAHYW